MFSFFIFEVKEEREMKAVVFHDVGDIRLDIVPDPKIESPTDAIIRLTSSAICGTDLHMVRGTMPGMQQGTILGHEGVGIIEDIGPKVRNFKKGDRVLVPSTISCGSCSYCRAGYTSQCDTANPNGSRAGTSFFGGPKPTGPINGLQAEYARIPFANAILIPLPDEIDDDRAILLSDILPTGYFGAQLAEIKEGDTVAVFGLGPVGQFALASAKLFGANRVIGVERVQSRIEMARAQGAEVVDFSQEDPVAEILELTGGIGVDRVVDAVGVDAESQQATKEQAQQGGPGKPDSGPEQALSWAIGSIAKAGTVGIIGVYPPGFHTFPLGEAMNMNLTLKMGNCNHRTIFPHLLPLVQSGSLDPVRVLTQREPMMGAIEAYQAFDKHEPGWVKAELKV